MYSKEVELKRAIIQGLNDLLGEDSSVLCLLSLDRLLWIARRSSRSEHLMPNAGENGLPVVPDTHYDRVETEKLLQVSTVAPTYGFSPHDPAFTSTQAWPNDMENLIIYIANSDGAAPPHCILVKSITAQFSEVWMIRNLRCKSQEQQCCTGWLHQKTRAEPWGLPDPYCRFTWQLGRQNHISRTQNYQRCCNRWT